MRWKFLLLLPVSAVLYGLCMLALRLHTTQMAYQFYELKTYERSLKEENLRLKVELAEYLSPLQGKNSEWKIPEPDEVVLIP
jgi:hypothetical protein